MATLYPQSLDSPISLPEVTDLIDPISAQVVNNLREAIIAIEFELGVKPSSVYSTVRNRLDTLENLIINAIGGEGNVFVPGNDLSGTITNQIVVGLQSRPVANVTPTTGQSLSWSGAAWTPTTPPISFTAGGDLSGNNTSQTVIALLGRPLSTTAPTSGQYLKWDGSDWIPFTVYPALTNVANAVLTEDGSGGLLWKEITQADIVPNFAINSFSVTSPAPGTYERGQTVSLGSSPHATATYISGPPTTATITNIYGGSSGGGDINLGAWTPFTTPFASGNTSGTVRRDGTDHDADPTLTVRLTATKTNTFTSDRTLLWTRRIYWRLGNVGGGETVNAAFVTGSPDSEVRTDRLRSFVVSPGNQYVYQIIPTDYGTPAWTLNGFPVPKSVVATLNITNAYTVVNEYKVFRSDNRLTGTSLSIVVG